MKMESPSPILSLSPLDSTVKSQKTDLNSWKCGPC